MKKMGETIGVKLPKAKRLPKPKFATREEWMQAFISMARFHFKAAGVELPKEIRVSVGFPSKGQRSKVIGECWSHEASTDRHAEIFIRPSLQSDASRVADVLTHELVHAAVGFKANHGPVFKRAAVALGLEGKMTATVAGEGWHKWADPILKELGTFPGADLDGILAGGKARQSTRMLKLTCDGCGWSCRTTKKHLTSLVVSMMDNENGNCPTQCGGLLTLEN